MVVPGKVWKWYDATVWGAFFSTNEGQRRQWRVWLIFVWWSHYSKKYCSVEWQAGELGPGMPGVEVVEKCARKSWSKA